MQTHRRPVNRIEPKAGRSSHRNGAQCALITLAVFAALAAAPRLAAQQPHYTVIDLGTLGGTYSGANGLNKSGHADGASTLAGDTAGHAFLWRHGRMIDLGSLGGPNSTANWPLNDWDAVAGNSDTTTADPNGVDFCGFGTYLICRSFVWREGVMTPLPTLGGHNTDAGQINNLGQVGGAAEIAERDPTCVPPLYLGYKPVIWERDRVRKLPTFPGDSIGAAFMINDRGQAAGVSTNCAETTAWHALMWDQDAMTDLGNLGGTMYNLPQALNNQGQVVGASDLSGDTVQRAFLWQNGVMSNLGTLPGYAHSIAEDIDGEGQVVGGACDQPFLAGNCRAFIWRKGVMTDLNTLIPVNSPLFLWYADGINSRGQITGQALVISSGEMHAFLATPVEREGGPWVATDERVESPQIVLPDNVRRLLQQQTRLGRFGRLIPKPQ